MTGAVTLLPYDAEWKLQFEREACLVRGALGEALLAIHHIGSTSVPGLLAKPLIDMLFVFRSPEAIEKRAPTLARLGYEARGEYGIAGRQYFVKRGTGGESTHHLHGYQEGSPHITRHLAFRDLLRTDPSTAAQYAALKSAIVTGEAVTRDDYQRAKASFIDRCEREALRRR
ncbi:GrpB family protein [Aurantiacibacter zhengii]|uniref:GrpB family protein n=1 Tax=Aurantiacibacter zhengii TaxID=2307003 RepID=A0A418NWX6_9SPHN|nr:GrpB family protein [Aurantiacibacter zhengii]RIV89088.1 GrpB family protein [Aurantiacibacter zhengii]